MKKLIILIALFAFSCDPYHIQWLPTGSIITMDRNDTNYKLYTRLANYNLECKVYEFGELVDSSVWVYKSSKTGGEITETLPAKGNYFNIEVVELCPIIQKVEGVTLRIELVGVWLKADL